MSLQTELNKIHSFWDLQDLAAKRKNFVAPEPQPLFHLLQFTKEFRVSFQFNGYLLEEFTEIDRPKKAVFIRSIKKHKHVGYTIRCNSSASNEQIETEIENLILPF